jgi:hypothetical protein
MCYEGTFDIAVFQTQFNIATVFKLLNKCFDGTLNYKVRFELEKGVLRLIFECLVDGFLEIQFQLRLYECMGTEKEMKLIAEIEEQKKIIERLENQIRKDVKDCSESEPDIRAVTPQNMPLEKISDALAKFLGKEPGVVMTRAEVSIQIRDYIKQNCLITGRNINPDAKLKSILSAPDGTQITCFNLQNFIKHNFIKGDSVVPPPCPTYPCIDSVIDEAVIDRVKYTLCNVKFGERSTEKWFRVELDPETRPRPRPFGKKQDLDKNVYLIGDVTGIRHLIKNSYTFYNGANIVTQYPPLMYPVFKMEDGKFISQPGDRFENGGFVAGGRTFENRKWCDFTYMNAEKVMKHFKL